MSDGWLRGLFGMWPKREIREGSKKVKLREKGEGRGRIARGCSRYLPSPFLSQVDNIKRSYNPFWVVWRCNVQGVDSLGGPEQQRLFQAFVYSFVSSPYGKNCELQEGVAAGHESHLGCVPALNVDSRGLCCGCWERVYVCARGQGEAGKGRKRVDKLRIIRPRASLLARQDMLDMYRGDIKRGLEASLRRSRETITNTHTHTQTTPAE